MQIKQAIELCPMALGCEALGGSDWGTVDIEAGLQAVRRAWQLGVRIFDTASIYGLGLSEERLAQALDENRHQALIVTKGGLFGSRKQGEDRAQVHVDLSPEALQRTVQDSLRRLRLECLPVFLVHRSQPNLHVDRLVETLENLKARKLISQFGFSNFPAQDWRRILKLVNGQDLVAQFAYSLVERDVENELLPLLRTHQVTNMAYGCLAQGFLSGKYTAQSNFDKTDRRHRLPQFQNFEQYAPLLQELKKWGETHSLSMSQAAIRWVHSQPGIDCTVVGAKNTLQLEQNLVAVKNRF